MATHATEVANRSPVLFLRLGEASGTTAADSSASGDNGTYVGGFTLGVADPLVGDGNTAVTLSQNTRGYVTVPHLSALDLTTTSTDRWTVELLYANPSGGAPTDPYPNLIAKGLSSRTSGWSLWMAGSPALFFKIAGTQWPLAAMPAWSFTGFTHVVVVFDGTGLTAYVNGVASPKVTTTQLSAPATSALFLNQDSTGSHFGNFTYDEVAIYKTALTSSDVAILYGSLGTGTSGTGPTLAGSVATVTAKAPAGSVSTAAGAATVAGPVAKVTVAAPAGSVLAGTATPGVAAFPVFVRPPDPYSRAIRNGIRLEYIVDASYAGVPVVGATDLRPVGGQITDTTKPGVRRTLNLELASAPGLFDLLKPIGTTLTVTAKVTYSSRSGVMIPMGVFDVDDQSLDEGGGKLTLTAPDKWQRIVRAKFVGPASSTPGLLVTEQIRQLIQGALGSSELVQVQSTSTAQTAAQTWTDFDRAKAILDMAAGAGLWVSFDRYGTATVADLPTVKSSPDWLIDASPSGILVELDRSRSRTTTYNLVVVDSSAADGPAFPTQYVWDSDSTSPTYAGPDPINHPELAGPFGVVTYHFPTPLVLDASGAQRTGATVLAQTVGLASQVSLSSVPNPAIDAFDAIDVMPPGGGTSYVIPGRSPASPGVAVFPSASLFPGGSPSSQVTVGAGRVLERHWVDTVTHSLAVDGPTHIDGRNARTDAYS